MGDISGNKKLRLRTSVFDPTGKLVTTSENEEIRTSENTVAIDQRIYLDNPILWNGKAAPNQYRFFCELLQGKKSLIPYRCIQDYVILRSIPKKDFS